jgi:superfamily I DNA/RNA helicase
MLNRNQEMAVNAKNGVIRVIAGPGSGKTHTLTERTKKLIEGGVSPERILSVTFTNKATDEMRERLSKALSIDGDSFSIFNFHKLAIEILNEDIDVIGWNKKDTLGISGKYVSNLAVHRYVGRMVNDGIINGKDAETFISGILAYIRSSSCKNLYEMLDLNVSVNALKESDIIDSAINGFITRKNTEKEINRLNRKITDLQSAVFDGAKPLSALADVRQLKKYRYDLFKSFDSSAYASVALFAAEAMKYRSNLHILSVDEVVGLATYILNTYDEVKKKWNDKFDYIQIDEFQDTNMEQLEFIKTLSGNNNIFVVGDPNQSIYGFRGSNPDI